MTIVNDGSPTAVPDSISGQLAAYGLLPRGGDGATTIDLSNATSATVTAPSRPKRPRLVRPQRTRDPMLIGWPSESGRQLEVWCPFCCNWHYHGRHGSIERCGADCACEIHAHPGTMRRYPCACAPGSGDGHRSAHCPSDSGSPFRSTGYQIREVRP